MVGWQSVGGSRLRSCFPIGYLWVPVVSVDVRLPRTDQDVPTWAVVLATALFAVTGVYSVLVVQSVLAVVTMWFALVGIGVTIYLVSLFVRLVGAVERIAEES